MQRFLRLFRFLKVFRRRSRLSSLVAEKLRGEDLRGVFVNRVVRSMKEYPDEWRVMSWTAIHESGVVVDARGYSNTHHTPGEEVSELFASITEPSFTILTKEESEILGEAFDYLVKLKVLESLGMDRE